MNATVEARPQAAVEAKPEKFVEVTLKRKYAPEYCYSVENVDGQIFASLDKDEKTNKPVRQADKVIGQKLDIFNMRKDVLKEIMDTCPPGTTIELPHAEAARLITAGVASPTSNTFR